MEGIRVHFEADFSTACGTIIVPVSQQGPDYEIPGLNVNIAKLGTTLQVTSFGNCLLLGQLSSQQAVFGLVRDETYDEEFIWKSMKNTIQRIALRADMRKVAISPIFQYFQSEFSANVNRFWLYLLLDTMKNGDLYICAAESIPWIKELLASVNAQLPHISLHFPVTRTQKLVEMSAHPFHCLHCLEYLEDAMVTTCCQAPVCKPCSAYQKACPICNGPPKWQEAPYIRHQTAELVYVCTCEAEVVMKDLPTHKLECPLSQFKCKLCSFDWTSRLELLEHLREKHADELLSNALKPRK